MEVLQPRQISIALSAALAIGRATIEMQQAIAAGRWHHERKRRTAVSRATPPWADQRAIELLYMRARVLSRRGRGRIKHHVDHVIPLQHPLVCGLHWEGNMQVIPQRDNCKKHNRWEP